MIDFRKITIADRERMSHLFALSDFRGAEYSFANSLNWGPAYNIAVAFINDFLFIRAGTEQKSYLFPVGKGDLKAAVQLLMDDAAAMQQPFVLRAVLPETKQELEQLFPGKFEFEAQRNNFDYIYLSEDLIHLSGKKYQPKRNHISRFKKTFAWSYEDISPANLAECIAMNEEWCQLYGCNENLSLKAETCAAYRALQNYFDENLLGGLLRVDGKVIAYTIGERLNSDTLVVHIEKAFAETYSGAYQVVNQEFLMHHATTLRYVNREDDAGDEGLRKAKLSYQPVFLVEKYVAKLC